MYGCNEACSLHLRFFHLTPRSWSLPCLWLDGSEPAPCPLLPSGCCLVAARTPCLKSVSHR
jgi:hypothetical protein